MRIDKRSVVIMEYESRQHHRNNRNTTINWQFTSENAGIKLKQRYPTFQICLETSLILMYQQYPLNESES